MSTTIPKIPSTWAHGSESLSFGYDGEMDFGDFMEMIPQIQALEAICQEAYTGLPFHDVDGDDNAFHYDNCAPVKFHENKDFDLIMVLEGTTNETHAYAYFGMYKGESTMLEVCDSHTDRQLFTLE